MSARVLLFGGTGEGRELAARLAEGGVETLLCVATGYGEAVVGRIPGLRVRAGRLDAEGMTALIRKEAPELVLDATHPYAWEASVNIKEACSHAGIEYIRLLRAERVQDETRHINDIDRNHVSVGKKYTHDGNKNSQLPRLENPWKGIFQTDSPGDAAQFLGENPGRALLTVGSKELALFAGVEGFRERFFARVLPDADVVAHCNKLGFTGKNLICMQGPFSHAMNVAMLRDYQINWLVTKDSGSAGGVAEKLSAAREAGVSVLLIRRPGREEGLSPEEVGEMLQRRFALPPPTNDASPAESPLKAKAAADLPRFPLFVNLRGRTALVVGGGKVGARRARTLLAFGAAVRLVAPATGEDAAELARDGKIEWIGRTYRPSDMEGVRLAVAATDDAALNAEIAECAAEYGVPSSVADNPEAGDFWFPAVAITEKTVAGMVSRDGDHAALKAAADHIRERLWEWDEKH